MYEPKERVIHRLPYYPDRIVHHAVLNILEPILVSTFTKDTYSCIKGRGVHLASYRLREAVKLEAYCLKLDIRKFYESIDHNILKSLLRRKFKDGDLLWLLDDIIDSSPGVPIGNYLSQYFGNLYLTGFDHWIKEVKRVKYYFRYCDDVVILGNKPELRFLLEEIRDYLHGLKLEVKSNVRIFPVVDGIDFVGYVHYPTHTLLRKSIKTRFIKMAKRNKNQESIAAYKGWLSHCDARNLMNKYFK
jgi:RNA-directed DNA polymerase